MQASKRCLPRRHQLQERGENRSTRKGRRETGINLGRGRGGKGKEDENNEGKLRRKGGKGTVWERNGREKVMKKVKGMGIRGREGKGVVWEKKGKFGVDLT